VWLHCEYANPIGAGPTGVWILKAEPLGLSEYEVGAGPTLRQAVLDAWKSSSA
jgi:hypothetical protein